MLEEQISCWEIEAVLNQVEKVSEQLKDWVRKQEYDFIIGDEFSGRIPALIIGEGINKFYRALSLPILPIRSIHRSDYRDIDQYLKDYSRGKRGLLITEAVHYGNSINEYRVSARGNRVILDVATLTSAYGAEYYLKRGALTDQMRFFTGNPSTSHSYLYNATNLLTTSNIDKTMIDIEVVAQKVAKILTC